jgi:hypothetical protein
MFIKPETEVLVRFDVLKNKVGKLFLHVGKQTSNLTVRGDLGLMTCFNKQKLSCIRLTSRLKRTEGDRLITTDVYQTRDRGTCKIRRTQCWNLSM